MKSAPGSPPLAITGKPTASLNVSAASRLMPCSLCQPRFRSQLRNGMVLNAVARTAALQLRWRVALKNILISSNGNGPGTSRGLGKP